MPMRSLYQYLALQVGPHVMFCCPCIVSSGISITCVIAHFVSTISADHDGKPHTYVSEYSNNTKMLCWFIVVTHFMPDSWGVAV